MNSKALKVRVRGPRVEVLGPGEGSLDQRVLEMRPEDRGILKGRLEALGQVWGSWGGSQGPRGMIWKPWVRLGL